METPVACCCTVTVAVAVSASNAACTLVIPFPIAVTRPASFTVTTIRSSLDQETVPSKAWLF